MDIMGTVIDAQESLQGDSVMTMETEKLSANLGRSRRHWYYVLFRIALISGMLTFVPSEPFLSLYLKTQKNVSESDLNNIVYPTDTYANLVFSLPVGIIAEFTSYYAVVLFGFAAIQATRILLIFGSGTGLMSLMQVTYALRCACLTVWMAYVLLLVPRSWRSTVVAISLSSQNFSNLLSSGLGQILVDVAKMNLKDLFYISWGTQTLALILFVSILPPRVDDKERSEDDRSFRTIWSSQGGKGIFREVWHTAKSMSVIGFIWTIWWVFAYAGQLFFGNYYQNALAKANGEVKYGVVMMFIELAFASGGCLAIFSSAKFLDDRFSPSSMVLIHQNIVVITSLASGVFDILTIMSTNSTMVSVSIPLRCLFAGFAQAVSQPAIARSVDRSYYALIFTMNTQLTFLLSTIISAIGSASEWNINQWFSSILALDAFVIVGAFGLSCSWVFWKLNHHTE